MSSHFASFTPDAMRAFGQALSAGAAARHEFVTNLFASSEQKRHETESSRRHAAAQDADARRLFVSELRSGVHALRTRFELARRDMGADFQQMANELNAARQACHDRSGTPPHRATRPAASRPKAAEPAPHEHSKPTSAQGEKSEHSKKRHA